MIEEGRGIDPPQRAVQVHRGQGEGQGEALGQHHLEYVSGGDIVFGFQDHGFILAGGEDRLWFAVTKASDCFAYAKERAKPISPLLPLSGQQPAQFCAPFAAIGPDG